MKLRFLGDEGSEVKRKKGRKSGRMDLHKQVKTHMQM